MYRASSSTRCRSSLASGALTLFPRRAATARANGLDPCAYLTHLFERLRAADTVEALEALLPWNARDVPRAARRAARRAA